MYILAFFPWLLGTSVCIWIWQPFSVLFVNHFSFFQSIDNAKSDALNNVETSSGRDLQVLESKDNPYHSKENQLAENAPPALDHTS